MFSNEVHTLEDSNGETSDGNGYDDTQEQHYEVKTRKKLCIRMVKFIFSTVGLTIVVALYSLLGGYIFMHLEQTNELETCKRSRALYQAALNDTTERMNILLQSYESDDDMENAKASMIILLQSFRDDTVSFGWNTTRDCDLLGMEGGQSYKWNLVGSILFAVTVTSTVGYGNVAPVTFWGRLVCLAYALMGIPIMLMFLAKIGNIFAQIMRFAYTKVFCCGFLFERKKKELRQLQRQRRLAEQAAAKEQQRVADQAQAQSSLPPGGVNSDDAMEQWKKQYAQNQARDRTLDNQPIIDDEDEEDEEDEYDPNDERSLPLTVALLIIFTYVIMGSLIFAVWEGWDIIASGYYCFITISTIGFGDIVPGATTQNKDPQKLMGAGFYMLIGMAILSMCFNLIQEEMLIKVVFIANLCGCNKKPDEHTALRIAQEKQQQQLNDAFDDTTVRRHMDDELAGNNGKGGHKAKANADLAKKHMMAWSSKKPAVAAPMPEEDRSSVPSPPPGYRPAPPATKKHIFIVD